MLDVLGLIAIVAVCAGLLFLASRIEPHWVAKDGRRFLTMAQELDQWGLPSGRRHEVRVNVDPDEPVLQVGRRSLMRPSSGLWRIAAKAPTPPRGKVVYFLKRLDGDGATPPAPRGALSRLGVAPRTDDVVVTQMALRLPARSKVVPMLDALLGQDGGSSP